MAVAELFPGTGSGVAAVISAVFVMTEPFVASERTVPTSLMTPDAPAAIDANVMVRLFPEPAQRPPPGALQETKLNSGGRLSVTVTRPASLGPAFLTAME